MHGRNAAAALRYFTLHRKAACWRPAEAHAPAAPTIRSRLHLGILALD